MKYLSLFILGVSLLSGCASTSAPRYQSTPEKNVTINVSLDERGGIFTSIDVIAGVYDLGDMCAPKLLGYVELSPGQNKLGLTSGKKVYLDVAVVYRTHGKSSNYARGTVLMPAKGSRYEVDVNYVDNMYDFRWYDTTTAKRKEQKVILMRRCN